MAKAVRAGVLSVNSNTSVRVNTPFGGTKQSGFGRELGMEALASFSDVKNVFLSTRALTGPGITVARPAPDRGPPARPVTSRA